MRVIDVLRLYNKEQPSYIHKLLDSLDKFELPNSVEWDACFDYDGWMYGIKDGHKYDIAFLDLWDILAMNIYDTNISHTTLFKYIVNYILANFELDNELYNNKLWKENTQPK